MQGAQTRIALGYPKQIGLVERDILARARPTIFAILSVSLSGIAMSAFAIDLLVATSAWSMNCVLGEPAMTSVSAMRAGPSSLPCQNRIASASEVPMFLNAL